MTLSKDGNGSKTVREVRDRGRAAIDEQLARATDQRTDPLTLLDIEDALRAIRGAGTN